MPAKVETLVHGPTLEQLDLWGKLDDLPWSLDSAVWPEADFNSLDIALPTAARAFCRIDQTAITSAICTAEILILAACTPYVEAAAHCRAVILTMAEVKSSVQAQAYGTPGITLAHTNTNVCNSFVFHNCLNISKIKIDNCWAINQISNSLYCLL